MSTADYLLLIGGMGAVTYLPRWLPLAVLSRRKLPDWLVTWLEFVPAAILAALVAPELLLEGQSVSMARAEFLVAVPTFLFALKTRSLGGTVVVGMLLYWGAGKVL
ncbi:MAG TPA: AzlD domain-containing protein [Verrucomicrobiae bacterium]|nr:AzlD domain-containing protein [Verrucomicrobiae bacterium]